MSDSQAGVFTAILYLILAIWFVLMLLDGWWRKRKGSL